MNNTERQPLQCGTDYRSDNLCGQLYECAVFSPDLNVLQGYERQILGKSRFPRCQRARKLHAGRRSTAGEDMQTNASCQLGGQG